VRLFTVIRRLRERGVGIVYISHRLEEIFTLADRVTVLKDGAWQGTLQVSETNTDDLIRRMIGRDVEKGQRGTASTTFRCMFVPEKSSALPALQAPVAPKRRWRYSASGLAVPAMSF